MEAHLQAAIAIDPLKISSRIELGKFLVHRKQFDLVRMLKSPTCEVEH